MTGRSNDETIKLYTYFSIYIIYASYPSKYTVCIYDRSSVARLITSCTQHVRAHAKPCKNILEVSHQSIFLVDPGRQHELGVVLFGLPEEETSNQLNDKDAEEYLGVKELCM